MDSTRTERDSAQASDLLTLARGPMATNNELNSALTYITVCELIVDFFVQEAGKRDRHTTKQVRFAIKLKKKTGIQGKKHQN